MAERRGFEPLEPQELSIGGIRREFGVLFRSDKKHLC
jgi:hypothetical protein